MGILATHRHSPPRRLVRMLGVCTCVFGGGGGGGAHRNWIRGGSIDRIPKILPRLTPGAPEVTQTQDSAKNENGISASKGVHKSHHLQHIWCKKFWPFLMRKKIFGAFSARVHNY